MRYEEEEEEEEGPGVNGTDEHVTFEVVLDDLSDARRP